MTEHKPVKITPAKGRPMLTWVGKRPLSQVTAFPAQHIETFDPTGDAARRAADHDLWSDWPDRYPRGGLLFHGDNKDVLAHLLANGFRGKIKLIYIDPPFDSGADYVRRVRLRGATGTAQIEGEGYTLGEQIQYEDIWANDNYLQFMYERLLLLRELLAEDGNIFVQMDDRRLHYMKVVMDEVFGADNFVNDIVWHKGREGGASPGAHGSRPRLPTEYQNLLLYAKNASERKWRPPLGPYALSTVSGIQRDDKGWYYTRGRMTRTPTPQEEAAGAARKTYVSYDPSLSKEEVIRRITSPTAKCVAIGNVWGHDLVHNSQQWDFPTEKPEALVRICLEAATDPGDLVLDCFIGSGTTAAVAQKLGRRWIGCDINKGAIQTTAKRLQTIILEQIEARQEKGFQEELVDIDDAPPEPAQLSFTVWRVNDYDLQIQHNEAVNLACEHIGIQRTRTDPFFDGTLGRNLVKIIPFNHPLSPLDLEEIRRELEARPEEDRHITVVCLGKELAADAWIEDWNRLRKGGRAVNRIEVIELRTDPRYGKFFEHKPASAKVKITRKRGQIHVEIEDFISPTIVERLQQQHGVLRPQIDDWRAMVDCVMIDPAYNGQVFNVALSDIPPKKDDLVSGAYTLPAPDGETTVAVKIIDMLGEEVLVTERV